MNGHFFSHSTFLKWGEKKRLNVMAGFCVALFAIGGLLGLGLLATFWEQNKIFISIVGVCLIAGWILKRIVNSKERVYKEEEREIEETYYKKLESTTPEEREELEWRIAQCRGFISQGIDPSEAYEKAGQMKYNKAP